jgi:hypothetical protein
MNRMLKWLTKTLFRKQDSEGMPRLARRALQDDMLGRLAVGPALMRRSSAWMRAVEGHCEVCGYQRACSGAYWAGQGGVWRPRCWNVSAVERTMTGS